MRVLITGASGFAGGHLTRSCVEAGDSVVGVSRSGSVGVGAVSGGGHAVSGGGHAVPGGGHAVPGGGHAVKGHAINLLDRDAFRVVLHDFQPEVVFHLAALSSVGRSWEHPAETMRENGETAVNVLEALRLEAPHARVIWVSSCEVYGSAEQLPTPEHAPLRPANPYAVSKLAGELLAEVYAEAYGLDVIRARPFNHTGPGQPPVFVVSSLARQAAQARLAGVSEIRLATGNPDTRRDFLDVRDTVRGYRLLAEQGRSGVYNVSSGRSISTSEQVQLIARLIDPIEVHHVVDPERVRAHEVMDLRGAHDRLTAATGWEPQIPFEQTVMEMISWWEQQLSQARGADAGGARGRVRPVRH